MNFLCAIRFKQILKNFHYLFRVSLPPPPLPKENKLRRDFLKCEYIGTV